MDSSFTGVLLGHDSPVALPSRLLQRYVQRQWVQCARFCHTLRISETELPTICISAL